jgi:hypothetical protein
MTGRKYKATVFTLSPNKDSSIGDNSRKANSKDMAPFFRFLLKRPKKSMMGSGWTVKDTVRENIFILLRLITKEIGTRIKKKEEGLLNRTRASTLASGRMTRKTARASSNLKMATLLMENGSKMTF